MLQEMARPATLWAAWARVAARSGMAGVDGVEVAARNWRRPAPR